MSVESAPAVDGSTARRPVSRRAAGIGAAGATLQVLGGVLETIDRVKAGEPGFALRTVVMAVAYVLILVMVLAIARSGVASHGKLARYGLVMVIAGWALSVVAQLALRTSVDLAEQVLFPTATIMIGAGMLVAGTAVLRAGRCRGWRRWAPLLCGLYPFAVVFPVFAAKGEPDFLVLSGWGACWLAVAFALLGATDAGS